MSKEVSETIHDLLIAGMRHHDAGDVGQARDAYLTILDLDPRHVKTLDLAGVLCMQCGESEAARDFYDAALEIEPENSRVLTHVGSLQLSAGDLEEAVDTFRVAAEFDEDCGEAQFFLALGLRGLGKRLQSLEALDEALALDGENSLFLSWRGTLAWETGDFESAINYLEQSVQADNNNHDALAQLGSVFIDLEDFPIAERCFRAALDLSPDNPSYRGKLGDAFARQGRGDEARHEFKVALEAAPNDALLLALYSVMLAGDGEPTAAADVGEKALGLDPENIEVHLSMLQAYQRVGDADAVERVRTRLRELAPDDARVDAVTK